MQADILLEFDGSGEKLMNLLTPSKFKISTEKPTYSKLQGVSTQSLRRLLKEMEVAPELEGGYRRALRFRKIARNACNYDITSKCNLFCEGCFYFEGDAQTRLSEKNDIRSWESFFSGQCEAGVSFANFAGAEPALVQDRLKVAAKYIKRGAIFTNGTIKIDEELPYVLSISVWGDEKETKKFRGGETFWKAIRNFARDPRARFVHTINGHNLDSIENVAEILDGEGARFAFNYFSPTKSYLEKLNIAADNDNGFFRFSNAQYNMMLSTGELAKAHDKIGSIIDKYPMSCLHTHEFNRWATQEKERYKIDGTSGNAINCNGRNFKWHSAYGVDMKPIESKCCTPNIECSECRLFAPGLNTILFHMEKYSADTKSFREWLSICDQWGRLFLLDDDEVWAGQNIG